MNSRKEIRDKNNKRAFRALLKCLFLSIIIAGGSYIWELNNIKNAYCQMKEVTVTKEGICIEELSRDFLPGINVDMGVNLIKKANGYVSDDITFLKGQKIWVPQQENTDNENQNRILMLE